jgi:hypothetical protein
MIRSGVSRDAEFVVEDGMGKNLGEREQHEAPLDGRCDVLSKELRSVGGGGGATGSRSTEKVVRERGHRSFSKVRRQLHTTCQHFLTDGCSFLAWAA